MLLVDVPRWACNSGHVSTDPLDLIRDEINSTIDAAGISEAELSRRTLIPRSTLARKLAGVTEFTLSELIRVADALDVEPARFIAAAGDAA